MDAFYAAHLAARAASFTTVDRSGNPDDLLTAPQAAKVLGYKDHRSLPDDLRAHPDDSERLPSGRLRRYWYRRTVWAYADGRPLRHSTGRPVGADTTTRQPHPYADDPRLDLARAILSEARPRTSRSPAWEPYLPAVLAHMNAPGNASSVQR